MKFIHKYKSSNFNTRKKGHKIKYIILHYTALESDYKAIRHLINKKNKVSSHFLINKKGNIFNLVDLKKRAWHAGKSFWRGEKDINSYSIGIELDNSGYQGYPKKQIESLIKLLNFLKTQYNISDHNILGHSDISPYRKKDPGEKFPWKKLSKFNLGITPLKILKKDILKINKYLKKKKLISIKQKAIFMFSNIGYDVSQVKKSNRKQLSLLVRSYQMHYRPKLANGKLDKDTFDLIVNHFNQTLTI